MSMEKTLCFFAALALAVTPLVAANDDPFAGTWKLDVEKSTYTGLPKPKDLTLTIVDEGMNRVVDFNGTAQDGSPIKVELTEPRKGGAIQITGAPPNQSWDSAMLKFINSTSHDLIYSKDGKEIAVRHIRMPRDHKSFIAYFTGPDPQGKTVTQNDVWEKQ
jgi:hypothetical protein